MDDETIEDGLYAIARAIRLLGNADASTPMGGLEALGQAIIESSNTLAVAMSDLAEAVRETKPNAPI